jgi:Cu/Zn superoxide dismutase
MDDDGSALLIHAQADDLISQPSGFSGARVVGGVVAQGDVSRF